MAHLFTYWHPSVILMANTADLRFQLDSADISPPTAALEWTDSLDIHIQLDPWPISVSAKGNRTLVVVPTENKHKVDIITLATEKALGTDLYEVRARKADSGKGDQPWGPIEGIEGACERTKNVVNILTTDTTFEQYLHAHEINRVVVISIESFINDTEACPTDYAFAIVYDVCSSQYNAGFSRGCKFPQRFIDETKRRERGGVSTTAGKVIAEYNPDVLDDDPHLRLCGESRYNIIAERLASLLNPLSHGLDSVGLYNTATPIQTLDVAGNQSNHNADAKVL